jgi:hypothetical protein
MIGKLAEWTGDALYEWVWKGDDYSIGKIPRKGRQFNKTDKFQVEVPLSNNSKKYEIIAMFNTREERSNWLKTEHEKGNLKPGSFRLSWESAKTGKTIIEN